MYYKVNGVLYTEEGVIELAGELGHFCYDINIAISYLEEAGHTVESV